MGPKTYGINDIVTCCVNVSIGDGLAIVLSSILIYSTKFDHPLGVGRDGVGRFCRLPWGRFYQVSFTSVLLEGGDSVLKY